jgi:membrane fusion protein, copper/silver efflux system
MNPHDPMPEGEEAVPRGARAAAWVRWALIAAMGLAAAASVVAYFAPAHDAAHDGTLVYYCPMHPSIVQDHPGECPICGMTLVQRTPEQPKSQGPQGNVPGLGAVELTPERVQLMGMKTAKVERKQLSAEIRSVGLVTANEETEAKIHMRFSGWIEHLHVTQTGQRVKPGQALATIYSPELLAAQQEYLSARQWSSADGALAGDLASDSRKRLELLGISSEEIAEIERTGRPLRAVTLRSPVAGYVVSKTAHHGQFVQPGTELFEVADLSSVWVMVDVYEADLARVREGQHARLELEAYPGRAFTGRVQFVYPTVSPETRTMKVRLAFDNRKLELKPGMYGSAVIELAAAEGLVAPAEAVIDTGEMQYVFVAHEGGRFEPRRVRTGRRAGEEVEILDGLADGETVVTTANFMIDSESRLKAAIGGFGAHEGH